MQAVLGLAILGALLTALPTQAEKTKIKAMVPPDYLGDGYFQPFIKVIEKSGIPFELDATAAPKRIFETVRANREPVCFLGPYKTAERETYGKFTKWITQDEPYVVIIRKESEERFRKHRAYESLIADETIIAAKPQPGVSTGSEYLDRLLAARTSNVDVFRPNFEGNIRKLLYGRLDWFRAFPADLPQIEQLANQSGGAFTYLRMEDEPEGARSYIFCSMQVPDSVIETLDATIDRLYPGRTD